MAEKMTAAEALGVLGGSEKQPQSEQELITSIIAGMTRGEKCFVLLWDSERVQIADLIQQQAATIEALKLCWNCKFIEADRCNKHNCLVGYPMRDKCDNWQVKEGNDV